MPEAITFATKLQLALAMIQRAIQAEVPFAWVGADSVYGVGEIELELRRAGQQAPPKTTLITKLAGVAVHPGDPARGDAAGAAAP